MFSVSSVLPSTTSKLTQAYSDFFFIRLKKLLFILVSIHYIKIDALLNNFLLPSLNVFRVINLSENISATYYKFNT